MSKLHKRALSFNDYDQCLEEKGAEGNRERKLTVST